MELRPEFQISTMIKAMTDAVLPAIDPQNKLALEQGHLVVATLRMLARGLPLALRYDRHELSRYVRLAERLTRAAEGGLRTRSATADLGRSAGASALLLERAGADGGELEDALREIRAKVGAFVQAVSEDGSANARVAVRRMVLDAAKEDLLRERAWVAAQGWEPDPSAVPPIESLLK